jgi:hypothetical protein
VSQPPWRISYTPPARRDLRRLDAQIRARVLARIEELAANDLRADARRLAGTDEYRLRSAIGEFGSAAYPAEGALPGNSSGLKKLLLWDPPSAQSRLRRRVPFV